MKAVVCCCAVGAMLFGGGGAPGARAGDLPDTRFLDEAGIRELGRQIFLRDWKAEGPAIAGSDGLGPMHNANSCVACHRQGAAGGGGPNENNVTVLSMVPHRAKKPAASAAVLKKNAAKLHSGFGEATSIILHAANTADADYAVWRTGLLEKVDGLHMSAGRPLPGIGLVALARVERNTPALFGAGQIDQIPDSVLQAVAQQQRAEVGGRLGRTAKGEIGRFGWRGQTAWASDFVKAACANELGLQVAGRMERNDPRRPRDTAKQADMTEEQVYALARYVVSLPAPAPRAVDEKLAGDVQQGRMLFDQVRCSACHLPEVGQVVGIFSDLLLHDMGAELADPVAAIPQRAAPCTNCRGYSGHSVLARRADDTAKEEREWRTPPLWGVADSGPYLHDGRAATLDAAIRLHSGEGRGSAARYTALAEPDREKLLAFLNSLAAPTEAAAK